MKKYNLFMRIFVFLFIYILATFLLRLLGIRFRIWVNLFVISIIILFLLFRLICYIYKKYQTNKDRRIIIIFIIVLLLISNLTTIIIFTSSKVKLFLKDIIPSIFISEHVKSFDDKKYVVVESSQDNINYYNYYGPFLRSTNLKISSILEETSKDKDIVIYIYYDQVGKVTKKEEITYYYDNNHQMISEHKDILYERKEEKKDDETYLLPEEEEILYEKRFNDTIMRFTKFDIALGQKNLVHIVSSKNGGKTYQRVGGFISLSTNARFTFVNELIGFALNNGELSLSDANSMYVTTDGGKTFQFCEFINQKNVENLTIRELPFYENDILKLTASVDIKNSKNNNYERREIIFTSRDSGVTWKAEK